MTGELTWPGDLQEVSYLEEVWGVEKAHSGWEDAEVGTDHTGPEPREVFQCLCYRKPFKGSKQGGELPSFFFF